MKLALLLYALLSTLSLTCVGQKWTNSGRAGDRGGRLISDVIDIDAEDAQFEVDGSADGADDDDDVQSGDDADDESSGDKVILTACQLRRQQAVGQSSSGHVMGAFIPRCTGDGYFEPLQCDSSTGECWCVDRLEGLELIGSRHRVPSMPDCTRFSVTKESSRPSSEDSLHSTSVRVIPRQFSTQTTTTVSTLPSTGSTRDEPSNKIDQFPNEPEIKFDGPADIDNNFVERPDQISEPRRRKMSLRASIIGQPGILAGIIGGAVIVLLCLVLLVMFCVYRMHRKSHEPEIFYIDKTARMPLSSNKKVGYMKALSADHDMYD